MKHRFFILLAIGSLILPLQAQEALLSPYYIFPREANQQIDLTKDWELSYSDDTIKTVQEIQGNDWFVVENPTSVQMALYKAGKLPNPYIGMNSLQYEPYEQKAWYYRKSFSLPSSVDASSLILSFGGIDYYAKIWLNGELLGTHEGMYGGPIIDITDKVKEKNELVVQVLSANYQNPNYMPRRPGKVIKTWFFTGDSGVEPFFHFGMWQGARIDLLNKYHIERPFLFTKEIKDNKAILALQLEIFTDKNSLAYTLHPWGNTSLTTYHSPLLPKVPKNIPVEEEVKIVLELSQEGKVCFQKEFSPAVIKGRSWLEEEIEVPNPTLWYPNGMGQANLYQATLKLSVNKKVVDVISFDTGIRTIEQVRSAGVRTQDRWANWQFVINGEKQFLKGMNWMPIDALSDLKRENYEWLIAMAHNAGVQMFRIWGCGYLETHDFYDLCNQYGIMVFQDFPIANFDTPEWPLDVWESLVCQNIFRLRNEPSLAVWSGGNEFNPYSFRTSAVTGVLERNIREFDPTRLYLRTSPDAGSMHSYPDFDPNWYKGFDLIPFVAESGIHCMTDARGIREVVDSKEFFDLDKMADSTFAKSHPEFVLHFVEYVPTRVPRMLSRATHITDITKASYEEMVEATQTGAGEFYQIMSESFQSNYPVTTGLFPWTYNRPWPTVAAINLVDGFGQATAPYYFLKRTFEKNRIMLDLPRILWKSGETIPLKVKILNLGLPNSYTSSVSVKVYNQELKEIARQEKKVTVAANSSVVETSFDAFVIPAEAKNQYFFLVTESRNDKGELISQAVYNPRTIPQMENVDYYNQYVSEPVPFPNLEQGPWLKSIVSKSRTTLKVEDFALVKFDGIHGEVHYTIKNTGEKPAVMNSFEIDNLKRRFYASDNFFWLNVGESKDITVVFQLREKAKNNQLVFSMQAWNAKTEIRKISTLKETKK